MWILLEKLSFISLKVTSYIFLFEETKNFYRGYLTFVVNVIAFNF